MAVPPGPTVLKQLDRAAKIAWCPSTHYSNLFATGTVAGTIDDSFETRSQLELYDINLSSPSLDLAFLGSITTKDSFHSVAWGSKGISDEVGVNGASGSLRNGIIAGGMSDGSVNLWSASSILSSSTKSPTFPSSPVSPPASSASLLSRSDTHKGQVLSLAFHPTQPNLLSSGATDGEVLVWDLAQPQKPIASKPNPLLRGQNPSVTAVAWNKKVASILASTNEHGETTVWDLRQKKAVISFRNSARSQLRATALAWNPEGQVHLAVVYANHPVCEVWDLRQSMTPKVKLEGQHTSSVLGMDWCPHDSKLLVTTGEDGRICLWDPSLGNYLTDLPSTGSAQFDVTWSPHHKNVLSMCSYEGYGKVSLQSIAQTGTHVPTWVQRPCSASFGFGGKLVTLGLDDPLQPSSSAASAVSPAKPGATQPLSTSLSVSTLLTDPKIIELSHTFQQVLSSGDFVSFCQQKIISAESNGNEEERITWLFMKILFEEERNQRFSLLKELGFDPPQGSDLFNNNENEASTQNHSGQTSQAGHPVSSHPIPAPEPEIPEDSFFDQDFSANDTQQNGINLNETKEELPTLHTGSFTPEKNKESENHVEKNKKPARRPIRDEDDVYTSFSSSDDDERDIRHALIYGDFSSAVARCLATGRLADAIIFSSFGPPQLFQDTRSYYFNHHKHPFIRTVMKNVSAENLEEMVTAAPLVNPNSQSISSFNAPSASSWKEVLAILVTYTTGDRYRQLVNQLAARLEESNMVLPALICYLCSSQIEKSVELLSNQSSGVKVDPALALHYAIEKIAVFAAATQAHVQPTSPLLAMKYSEYATLLASQGYFIGAWNYLRLVSPTSTDPSTAILLDRLYHASHTTSDQAIHQPPPPFPFSIEQVGVDPMMRQLEQQVEAWKRAKEARIQASAHHQSIAQQQQIKQQQDMLAIQQPQQSVLPNQQLNQQQHQQLHQRPGSYSQPQPQPSSQPHQGQGGQFYSSGQTQMNQHQNPYQPQPPTQPPSHLAPNQPPQHVRGPSFPQPNIQNQPLLQQQPNPYNPASSMPMPMPNQNRSTPQFQPTQPLPQPPTQSPHSHPHTHPQTQPHPQTQTQPHLPPQPAPGGVPHPARPGFPQPTNNFQPTQQAPPHQSHLLHQTQLQPTQPSYGGTPSHTQLSYGQPHMPQPIQHSPSQQHSQFSTNNMPPPSPYTQPHQHPAAAPVPHQPQFPSSQNPYQPNPPNNIPPPSHQQQHSPHHPLPPSSHQQPTMSGPSHPMPQPVGPAKVFHTSNQPPSHQIASAQPAAALMQSTPPQNQSTSAPSSSGAQPLASLSFPPEYQSIVSSIEQTIQQIQSISMMPPEQRKLTNIIQHILLLYNRLAIPNHTTLTPSLINELSGLVSAMSSGDITLAERHRMNIVRVDWNGNNEWLMALKNLLLMKKKYVGGR